MSLFHKKTKEEKKQDIRALNHRLLFDELTDELRGIIQARIKYLQESIS